MSDEKVHVHWHDHSVSREERREKFGHQGCVIWFTGLSACGKSTIANALRETKHDLKQIGRTIPAAPIKATTTEALIALIDGQGNSKAKDQIN